MEKTEETYNASLSLLNFKTTKNHFPYIFSATILLDYSVELCLKIIILSHNIKIKKTHNLEKLWEQCKSLVNGLNDLNLDPYCKPSPPMNHF